ncbi:Bystin-domain containing protein [Nitzschia inconspicua]|uniref:Bystin-domain containing protein n=1 Tax=Nitzschia inconspicua TaxID=303405 RepID=A0A9K3PNF9_9STRA|nr:Bystin-domain containing protein [Nitzschia inconspicua]
MPKVKKLRAPALDSQQVRHEPLGQVIDGDANRGKYAVPSRRRRSSKEIKQNDEYLDEKTSRRILEMSQEQDLEEELEEQRRWTQQQIKGKRQQNVAAAMDSDEEEDEEVEDIFIDEVEEDYIENDQGYVNVKDGTLGISTEDEAIVAAMNKNSEGAGEERRTLADLILGKIAEKEARDSGGMFEEEEVEEELPPLPKKVVDVYTDIGKILSRYTSGKLPKAFKVIPSLSNWEQVLYLTRPDLWTPQAMYAATRIFASNLNPKMAQRFYYLVLLDAVRADIYEHKKLNYHYYISLKKAVYKPAAFFKGILLPLCKEECTLREAAIVASVLQRVSIPVHHSAVAIHKLAQMTEYNGAASIFIKTLLNKKYALPVPVIGSLVQHFASFINDDRDLPVLWHQALLVFVQRYKNEVKDQARESLRLVMKKHFHHKITPEIRRELFGAAAWKEERSTAVSKNNDSNMVLA